MDMYGRAELQNRGLAESLEFTREELAMNRAGLLSERQRKMLNQTEKLRGTGRTLAVVMLMVSLGVLWVVGYSLMIEEEASLRVGGQFGLIVGSWIAVGVVVGGIFALFLWIDRKRGADLRSGTISVVEGPARLFMREMKGARLYGMKGYYVEVGQVEFQVADAKQYGAFEQGNAYRIFYVKNPPTQTILSVEWVG